MEAGYDVVSIKWPHQMLFQYFVFLHLFPLARSICLQLWFVCHVVTMTSWTVVLFLNFSMRRSWNERGLKRRSGRRRRRKRGGGGLSADWRRNLNKEKRKAWPSLFNFCCELQLPPLSQSLYHPIFIPLFRSDLYTPPCLPPTPFHKKDNQVVGDGD